ncbi:protein argos [Arctopsyche grandis]|uniref:protein argos n=1 Tax=Arctopsyche grandis TaxID=121162 RepID=UPI00406D8125
MWRQLALVQLALTAAAALRLPMEVFQGGGAPVRGAPLGVRSRPDRMSPQRRPLHRPISPYRTLYQTGNSEEDLPICSPHAVCNKIDLYDENQPWIERQCRCPGHHVCKGLATEDGHTLVDRTRQYKLCEPVKKLPKCRYFRDATWTLISSPDVNATEQIVHCHCPRNSITYLQDKHSYETSTGRIGYQYTFACSPQSRLRCGRKEPCRLFTVRKRQEALEEVNASTLCQCPRSHVCPSRHTSIGVLPGRTYAEESIRTYSGYCMDSPQPPEPHLDRIK